MPVDYSKEYKNIIMKPFKFYIIQAVPFILLIKKQNYKIFIVIIEDIKKVLKPK
jgi:hypothetical protein